MVTADARNSRRFNVDFPCQAEGHESHILAFTDSSSALVWINKASFEPVNAESHDVVARWIGWKLVSNETSLYSQHTKVIENTIAD